jgi:hypothetical protein
MPRRSQSQSGGYHTIFRSVKHVPFSYRRQNGELFHQIAYPSEDKDAPLSFEVARYLVRGVARYLVSAT